MTYLIFMVILLLLARHLTIRLFRVLDWHNPFSYRNQLWELGVGREPFR